MRILEKRNMKVVRLVLILGTMCLFVAISYQAVQQVETFPLGKVRSNGFRALSLKLRRTDNPANGIQTLVKTIDRINHRFILIPQPLQVRIKEVPIR